MWIFRNLKESLGIVKKPEILAFDLGIDFCFQVWVSGLSPEEWGLQIFRAFRYWVLAKYFHEGRGAGGGTHFQFWDKYLKYLTADKYWENIYHIHDDIAALLPPKGSPKLSIFELFCLNQLYWQKYDGDGDSDASL